MLREMGELLDRYTERRPLLLVTEDLHWSDQATVRLIDYIARRRGSARLMWLASFRLAEVVALEHPLNSLRHELRLHGLCEEIQLDPFSEVEIAEYVALRSSTLAADEAFVRGLLERTDGVPLFVASMLNDVVARSAQEGEHASVRATLASVAVPENLAAVIDHYIALLSGEQRQLLAAAAVCGVEFRAGTVASALGLDALAAGQACEELAREQMWLRAPRAVQGGDPLEQPYSFRHALFRQVLYERTAPALRAQLHRKVGAALERERAAGAPVAAAELAMHFELGREPLTALRCYAEAAQAALARLAPAECMGLTGRALALLDQTAAGGERDVLELTLATLRGVSATHVAGVGAEAKSAFQRAYARLPAIPGHPLHTLLLHGFGFVLSQRAEYAEALAVAERAVALGAETNDPVLELVACSVRGHAHMLQGRPKAARAWLERGLLLPEDSRLGGIFVTDPRVLLLGLLGIQLLHLGELEAAHETLQQAHARASELGQPFARMVAIWCDALFELRLGDVARVAALAEEMHALVEEQALAQGQPACQWFRGWVQARRGEPREGYRRIREGYEANVRVGMLAGGSETLGYGAEALVLAGDWDAAETQLREALQFADAHGERVYLPQLYLIEAAIARGRGQADAARAAVGRAVAEARAQEAPWLEQLALGQGRAGTFPEAP
jgi:tetratricopeptide (TPR) repeat protein